MPRLSPGQLAKADRLQKAGQTLREIAGELGVSFEAVCLGLYGGNAGWSPKAEADDELVGAGVADAAADQARSDDGSLDEEPTASGPSPGADAPPSPQRGEGTAPPAAAAAAPGPADEPPAEAVAEVRAAVAEAGSLSGTVEPRAVAEPVAAPVVAVAREVPQAAPVQAVAPPHARGTEFRLADELGQWLSRDGQKMTRDIARAWKGVSAQVAVIQKRHPHLRQLILEPVEDA